MTGTEDSDQTVAQVTDGKRAARSADGRDRSPPPSPEELQRLVALHLGSSTGGSRRSPWLIRLVSAVLAVLALVLLFALLPELGSSAR